MVKEICPNIYLNEIDLPKNPLKYLNSYIIKSEGRSLIIDTGFNRPECMESFFGALAELSIDPALADVLITHLHSDHCGMMGDLEDRGASIMFGDVEAPAIVNAHSSKLWSIFEERAKMLDLTRFSVAVTDHPGYRYRPASIKKYRTLKDGQILTYGRYNFQVMHVPGHTKGHIALYEPERKMFFCGDLILDKITPTITFWGFEQDILQVYLDTLNKVKQLDIELLLTGHRKLLTDHKKRIDELFEHHEKRLAEIMDILSAGENSVSGVASKMTWEITAKSWEDFPKAQKWFASSEAMAHLEYLFCHGKLARRRQDGAFLYALA